MSKSKSECVKVVVRCRPLDKKEIDNGHKRCVDMETKMGVVTLNNPKAVKGDTQSKTFTYDAIYDWNSVQQDLYDEIFRDLVDSVMQGFNGTIFAYGQTGTGKTYTMQGTKDNAGVIPNSFDHVFTHISRSENQQYLVRASYLEIYLDEIKDLLSKDQTVRLELKERPDSGVYVKDLSSFVTKSVKEIEHVMSVGNQNRSVGATNMNEHSSRSHAIFVVTVECSELGADGENHIRVGRLNLVDLAGSERQSKTGSEFDLRTTICNMYLGVDGENHIRVGRLNLVDLAGSERQSKTGSEGNRLKEATKINLSLSALGNVISALVDGKSTHIPYRDSKLTRLLQDSLGGNAKTVMVANIGPASYNYDETLSTLRYANRAKDIKNKPTINEDPKDALLREFQEEIERLKKTLETKGGPKKKRKVKRERRNADGELIEDDEDDEEGEVNDEEEYERNQREILEQQKQSILNNQSLISEEKQRYLQDLKDREEKLSTEKQNKDALTAKIKAMESKLLQGGRNIVDHTNEQQRALELRRREIVDQKMRERDMQRKLDTKEETATEMHDHYTSLQQEVDVKTKKLKKLFAKLQSTRQDIIDLQEEHSKERQELEQTQMELTRELKLKMLIIENFIPTEERTKVSNRSYYDDDVASWKMKPLTKSDGQPMAGRPVSALNNKRPTCQYAALASKDGNPRFKGENILLVELDMPNRTTRDYEGPAVAPRVQAALDAAMRDEDDIDVEARSLKAKLKSKKKDSLVSKMSKVSGSQQFPSSRGLVPRSK